MLEMAVSVQTVIFYLIVDKLPKNNNISPLVM